MWAPNYPESLWGVNMRTLCFWSVFGFAETQNNNRVCIYIKHVSLRVYPGDTGVIPSNSVKKKIKNYWSPLGREQCRLRLLSCHPSSSSIMSKCLPQQPVLLTTHCLFEDKDNPVKFLSGSPWLRSETTSCCEPLDLTLCLCLGSTIAHHLAILGAFPHKLNQVTALHRDPSIFYVMLKLL